MTNKTLTVIDCQVFQTLAWHRGMGKYSFELLRAVANGGLGSDADLVLIFSKNLKTPAEATAALKQFFPEALHVYLDIALSDRKNDGEHLEHNRDTLNAYLNTQPAQHINYLILALFLDEVCVAFPALANKQVAKFLLVYDIIPFLYSERYGRYPGFLHGFYFPRFNSLLEADVLFTISQTVANDLITYLGVEPANIVNIDGAAIPRESSTPKKPNINLPKKFILAPTGNELRKNNLRMVRGFEKFRQQYAMDYALVLTSTFDDDTRARLSQHSDALIFTGNIPGAELLWLYKESQLLLFASEYEGLGLPILEAAEEGKKIVCSDIPVFKEISTDAFYMFDALNPLSIARAIESAVKAERWEHKRDIYPKVLKKYTWKSTGARALAALTAEPAPVIRSGPKPRLAVFTPDPEGFSAIGKVTAETHLALSAKFDVDYYVDKGHYHRSVRPDYLSSIAPTYDAKSFDDKRYQSYDAVVYHIGNSDYHLNTIKSALRWPGFAIIHDTRLKGAFENMAEQGIMSIKRLQVEQRLNGTNGRQSDSYLTSIVNTQLGILSHSNYADEVVASALIADVPHAVAGLPVSVPQPIPKTDSGPLQIGLAGILADIKGLSLINDIASNPVFYECKITVFGHSFGRPEILQQMKRLRNVRVITNPTDFQFQSLLAKQDILINYRLGYQGETSLTTLEAMRYGAVVMVRDIGWYSELPDDAVVKCSSTDDVITKLQALQSDPEARAAISLRAVSLMKESFTHAGYVADLEQLIGLGLQAKNLNGQIREIYRSGLNGSQRRAKLKQILGA